MLQYYQSENVHPAEQRLLISGSCPAVKTVYLSEALKSASRSGYGTIVIDYGRTGDFSAILHHHGFTTQRVFTAGRDNYQPVGISVHTAIFQLRTHAQRLGYDPSDCAMMTAFLGFLTEIEPEDDKSHTIQQLLYRFRNQDKLEEVLITLVRRHVFTRQQATEHIQTYLEYVRSGITADMLLAELKFITTPNQGEGERFSLISPNAGETSILCASENNSTDMNDYLSRLWTADLIQIAENTPLLIIINTGHHQQISRVYELVETLSHKENIRLFYSTYDLFSGVEANQAKAFAKLFNCNVYGTHSGDSAGHISNMFGEHWITQYNCSETKNRRILGESLLDLLFHTDRSVSMTATPVKESIFPAEKITAFSPREYVIFDTLRNTIQSAHI